MSTTLNKLEYTDETKGMIKTALNTKFGAEITDQDTFRSYVNKIGNIYNDWPKVTGAGNEVTLNGTKKGKMLLDIQGNSVQDGEPTPDNPIPIKSAGDDGTITEKIINKNWFDKTNVTVVWGKGYSSSGEWINYTAPWGGNNYKDIVIKENTEFILSGKLVQPNYTERFHFFDINGNFISVVNVKNTGGIDKYVFTTPSKAKYLSMQYNNGYYDVDTIQIEEGSTAGNYQPHQEQTFIIPCQQPMEYLSYENSRDVFVKENGIWYERHKTVRIKTDGTEEISIYSSNSNRTIFEISTNVSFYPIIDSFGADAFLKCTHFKPVTQSSTWSNGQISTRISVPGKLYIILGPGITVEEFKTWLSNNNVETLVVLVTPTNLPCTEEQTAILETIINSYEDQTNVYTEDGTPAYIEVSALKKGGN